MADYHSLDVDDSPGPGFGVMRCFFALLAIPMYLMGFVLGGAGIFVLTRLLIFLAFEL